MWPTDRGLLSQTRLALLVVESLTRKLAEAADGDVQIGVEHPLWQAMARLFPEVFNGVVRAELQISVGYRDGPCLRHAVVTISVRNMSTFFDTDIDNVRNCDKFRHGHPIAA